MKADPNLDHWNAFDLIFDLGIKSMTAHADDEVFEHIINQSLNYWLLRKFGEIVPIGTSHECNNAKIFRCSI